jgi:WXXGXW repeat (2 copies)
MKRNAIATTLLGALILAGCAGDNPPAPVPAPMAESIPKPPVSPTPMIWQAGHWDWTGSAYVWVPGQFVAAEGHGNLWMPGYWEKTVSGWVWHAAHWT